MSGKSLLIIFLIAAAVTFGIFAGARKLRDAKAVKVYQGIINKDADRLARQAKRQEAETTQSARLASVGSANLVKPVIVTEVYLITGNGYQINPGDFVGTQSREALLSLLDYAAKSDKQGFVNLLNQDMKNKLCVFFIPGEKITLDETDPKQTIIKVTRLNGNQSYWTIAEAIK